MRYDLGSASTLNIHLTLVPYLQAAGELKTKPTQHSVKQLLSYGLQPDVLVCRTEHPLDDELRGKIARFTNVETRAVVASPDAESIYEVPLLLKEQGLDDLVVERLGLKGLAAREPDLKAWTRFLQQAQEPQGDRPDRARRQVRGASGCLQVDHRVVRPRGRRGRRARRHPLRPLRRPDARERPRRSLDGVAGVLVAPGFGERGIEGKIAAVRHVRENGIPFFGICLGMQMAVIEYARHVCGWPSAHSAEFDAATPAPGHLDDGGAEGDHRQGRHDAARRLPLRCRSRARRRARPTATTEVTGAPPPPLRGQQRAPLQAAPSTGCSFTGMNPDRDLVEIVELPDHPWFVGVQFHPEYRLDASARRTRSSAPSSRPPPPTPATRASPRAPNPRAAPARRAWWRRRCDGASPRPCLRVIRRGGSATRPVAPLQHGPASSHVPHTTLRTTASTRPTTRQAGSPGMYVSSV